MQDMSSNSADPSSPIDRQGFHSLAKLVSRLPTPRNQELVDVDKCWRRLKKKSYTKVKLMEYAMNALTSGSFLGEISTLKA
jgi:hypothetical protein